MSKRVFWNSCPRNLGYLPQSACELGQASAEKRTGRPGCEWYINDPASSYCFWKWVRGRSDAKGSMEPLLLNQIGTYLNIPSSKVHVAVKEALSNLQDLPEFEDLEELFE